MDIKSLLKKGEDGGLGGLWIGESWRSQTIVGYIGAYA